MLELHNFRSDQERRDFISIGAASGFVAAFGAPVGGVLFSMEEASSFFAHTMLFKTIVATTLAIFCIVCYHGALSMFSVLQLKGVLDSHVKNIFYEIPLYALIGACGGHIQWNLFDFHENTDEFSYQFNCKTGSNEIFNALHSGRDSTIGSVLSDPAKYDPRTLFITGILVYVLMTLAFGMSIPSGIFMPTTLSGSTLGGLAGLFLQKHYLSSISPSTFALLGAAALLAGTQRNTVSLSVILMEGTGQTKVLISLITTIFVANYVGTHFNDGIYEIVIELKDYSYLAHRAKRFVDVVKTLDIMSCPVTYLHSIEQADRIEQVLLSTTHIGFPVVDKESGQFLGLVRRDQLVALLEFGVFMKDDNTFDERDVASQKRVFRIFDDGFVNVSIRLGSDGIVSQCKRARLSDGDDWLAETLPSYDACISNSEDTMLKDASSDDTIVALRDGNLVIFLAAKDLKRLINVAAIMNRGAYSVTEGMPLSKTYSMFTALGLRPSTVLGPEGKVSGIRRRKNLPHTLEEKINFKL